MSGRLSARNHLAHALRWGAVSAFMAFLGITSLQMHPVLLSDDKADARARLGELQQKAAQLNEQIRQNQQAANAKKKEASSLQTQITNLSQTIEYTQVKIDETAAQITDLQGQIDGKQQEITTKQVELDKQKANQNETLRVLYETGDTQQLLTIAGSNSISDYVRHNEYLQSLEDQIAATIAEVEKLKRELEQQRSDLQSKQKELEGLKAQSEAYKAGLNSEKSQKDSLLSQTKTQQAQYEEQVKQARDLNAQVEAEMSSLRAKLTKSSGPGVIQAKDRGTSSVGFQWPTDYLYISTYFGGSTPFQPNGGHGGIDLVNSAGTPIYAAAGGTVTAVEQMKYNGQYYAYGQYIVIGHNARWSSLYGHLQSFAVAPGDEVKRGNIIGYMGCTGWCTGPHLHFEIWDYSARANPLDYLP